MTILPRLPSSNENSECELNSIQQLLYMYLSGYAFLAHLTPSNKQTFQVKSEFKSRDHVSNL